MGHECGARHGQFRIGASLERRRNPTGQHGIAKFIQRAGLGPDLARIRIPYHPGGAESGPVHPVLENRSDLRQGTAIAQINQHSGPCDYDPGGWLGPVGFTDADYQTSRLEFDTLATALPPVFVTTDGLSSPFGPEASRLRAALPTTKRAEFLAKATDVFGLREGLAWKKLWILDLCEEPLPNVPFNRSVVPLLSSKEEPGWWKAWLAVIQQKLPSAAMSSAPYLFWLRSRMFESLKALGGSAQVAEPQQATPAIRALSSELCPPPPTPSHGAVGEAGNLDPWGAEAFYPGFTEAPVATLVAQLKQQARINVEGSQYNACSVRIRLYDLLFAGIPPWLTWTNEGGNAFKDARFLARRLPPETGDTAPLRNREQLLLALSSRSHGGTIRYTGGRISSRGGEAFILNESRLRAAGERPTSWGKTLVELQNRARR